MSESILMWGVHAVLGGFATVLWFMFKDIKRKCETTNTEFLNYKTHVAEQYVPKSQLDKTMEGVNRSLDALLATVSRIEERLYKKEQN